MPTEIFLDKFDYPLAVISLNIILFLCGKDWAIKIIRENVKGKVGKLFFIFVGIIILITPIIHFLANSIVEYPDVYFKWIIIIGLFIGGFIKFKKETIG